MLAPDQFYFDSIGLTDNLSIEGVEGDLEAAVAVGFVFVPGGEVKLIVSHSGLTKHRQLMLLYLAYMKVWDS